MKSLRLHLVFATSTTRQLVSSILHFKTARKHSCEVPQHSQGGQLKTHPDIHVRVVWHTRKESVEERLARKREKKAGLSWLKHYHLLHSAASMTVVKAVAPQPEPSSTIKCDNRCVILSFLWRQPRCCIIIYDCDNWVPSHGELKHATANLENYSVRADGSECWSGCKTALRRSCLFVFKHKKAEAYKGFCHRPLCSSHQ